LNRLGFHIAFDARVGSGERLLAVAPPDGSAVLTLIQANPDSPQAKLVGRATQVVFVTEDVPATYTEWRRRGVRFRSAPRLRRVIYEQTNADADRSSVPATVGHDRDLTLKAAALELGFVTEAEFDRVVDPRKMVRPYVATAA
jgi:hypothetical protein